jgi:hypothetical protein
MPAFAAWLAVARAGGVDPVVLEQFGLAAPMPRIALAYDRLGGSDG